jgi:hypothetical protein
MLQDKWITYFSTEIEGETEGITKGFKYTTDLGNVTFVCFKGYL